MLKGLKNIAETMLGRILANFFGKNSPDIRLSRFFRPIFSGEYIFGGYGEGFWNL